MHLARQRLVVFAILLTLGAALGCRDKAQKEPVRYNVPKIKPMTEVPSWVPLRGLPLPGHGNRPGMLDSPFRPMTPNELMAVAYKYHPQMGDPETYSIEEWDQAFWYSPEQLALSSVQRVGYERLQEWRKLCAAVRRSIPPVYTVAERTYPRYYPTYMIVVDAPIEKGTNEERFLVLHLSYLVPYYFYYELHSRRVPRRNYRGPRPFQDDERASEEILELIERKLETVDIHGLIERDPLLYEVTPVFKDVLAAIEREIAARYGYWRMLPEVAAIQVPGIEVAGYHDWEKHPPTLQDALFTPQRW